MFVCGLTVGTKRVLAKALVSIFIGASLFASAPQAANFLAPRSPGDESNLVNIGDFPSRMIAGPSFKKSDLESKFRLSIGKVWHCPESRRDFCRAIEQSIIHHDAPTAGSFLIRSPPSYTVA
jgi:hypothetical protein